MNNKYFTAKEIYARLISSYRSKGKEISPIMVMHWCSELITDCLRDPAGFEKNTKHEVEVKGNKALLPYNIFKLEGVYNEKNQLIDNDYMYQGQYIFFSDRNCPKKIYIDYLSIPIDMDGFPYIKRGYELAAYSYCVYKMFEEDATAIPPRIQQWRWLQICQDKDWEIEAASRSWDDLTDNDIRQIHNIIMGNVFVNRLHIDTNQ